MTSIYDVGNLVVLSATFTDVNNNLVDPTTVSVSIKTPDGVVNTYSTTRVSNGFYTYNLTLVQTGLHYYRFVSTGTVVTAADGQIFSQASPTLS